ncbi:MAG TPA: hypothetical protein EYO18_06885 [Candidatus Marinimicrobia bacterium]|nr:hypothetical protein [Candidatus Neomarinimicrobiota bacterium]
MNTEIFANEKSQVADVAREMSRLGLVSGSSGNVSMRISSDKPGFMAITPMGVNYRGKQWVC